jgi:hypothetical protein
MAERLPGSAGLSETLNAVRGSLKGFYSELRLRPFPDAALISPTFPTRALSLSLSLSRRSSFLIPLHNSPRSRSISFSPPYSRGPALQAVCCLLQTCPRLRCPRFTSRPPRCRSSKARLRSSPCMSESGSARRSACQLTHVPAMPMSTATSALPPSNRRITALIKARTSTSTTMR